LTLDTWITELGHSYGLALYSSERRIFSRQEIAALNSELKNDDRGDAMKFTIIDNKIYDVSDFVHEHPGGVQVLLTQLGKDATGTFFFFWAYRELSKLFFFVQFVGVDSKNGKANFLW
jgi:Cytochrome b5-like Heme/Steroid binding domain